MTPDEVCAALEKIGANVSRRTLLNYEEYGLIPTPQRGGGGRNGRFTDYPDWTIEEAFAAWSLIHGKYGNVVNSFFEGLTPKLSPAAVNELRNLYYSGKREDSRTESDTKEAYLHLSRQMLHDINQYTAQSAAIEDEFTQQEIQECLCDASIQSVEGMKKIKWGFLVLWRAERLRARALVLMARK